MPPIPLLVQQVHVHIILRIRHPRRHVPVLPQCLIEDGLVQRFLGSAQPHAPFFDRAEVEEVSVDLVCEDGDEEATDGVEEVVVGGGLWRDSCRGVHDGARRSRAVNDEKDH
jgi:hypothetical protein